MAKRKVIEDSDDDKDEATPPRRRGAGPGEANSSAPFNPDETLDRNDVAQSVDHSTGSTELLNREIRAAHKSLIEPTPNGSSPSVSSSQGPHQHSQSLSGTSRSKLERAKTAVERPRAKKPLRKYGTESKYDVFDFHGDSYGEAESFLGRVVYPKQTASNWTLSSGDTVALGSADLLPVRPTVGNVDTQRMSPMPPPASKSTSIEQTQISETCTKAKIRETYMENTPAKSKSTEETKSIASNYSDGWMPTPTMSSHRSNEKYAQDISGFEDPFEQPRFNTDATDPPCPDIVAPSSSASILSPSKTIAVGRRDQTADNSTEHFSSGNCEYPEAPPASNMMEQVNPNVSLPAFFRCYEKGDELSLPMHGPETWSVNQTTLSKAKERKKNSDQASTDEPGSDDLAIGLPKDQYQPRASKFRSGRSTEEVIIPADFSKRPETLAKKRRKLFKSKTTAFDELMPDDKEYEDYDNSLLKLETEGSDYIPQPQVVEKSTNPEVEEKEGLDEVKEGPLSCFEAPQKPANNKKQRGRPKKAAKPKAPDENNTQHMDAESTIAEADNRELKEPEPPKKSKKGAKSKPATIAISAERINGSDDELGDMDNIIHAQNKTPNEACGTSKIPEPVKDAAASPSPSKDSAPPPRTPRKEDSLAQNSPAQKGPDKHSPISSGKVAYRVGLSKRARIAPLLRIVRKT